MADEIDDERKRLLQAWLQHAPSPPERRKNSYDVFISYRSSDRSWAMALYDALKLAGWEAFLDQYDLVPGANLEGSLTKALEKSSSGVILWSSRTEDSVWCERERNAMRTLSDRLESFNYVFAKLDDQPLPLFAQSDLYIDFEDSPAGPRGVNLLKLVCGLKGIPLAPEAVEMAQEVDEPAKESLISIEGAIQAEDAAGLRELGTSSQPGFLASPTPVLAAAEGLISMGKCEEALMVLEHALAHFPKSIRARQLKGLALRRLKRYRDAIKVLSKLQAAGHQDPETLGMLGASWDGRYQEGRKTKHLRKSRELYRAAFQGDPKDHYTGINAASKSLFLGESEEAERLAGEVLPLVEAARDAEDFWAGCTLGEVYLLKRDLDSAVEQYQKIIDRHGARSGDLAGTREQAERICAAHGLSAGETTKVLAPFALLDE